MREDFNKLLVERERARSHEGFGNYRHKRLAKGLLDDEVAGRESMKRRYQLAGAGKSFSENLNPLYGWLRTCVGKNWDKCYSELCNKFDMRGVINEHILQHLWSSVERYAFIGPKGAVMAYRDYAFGGKSSPYGQARPIKESDKDYYICPKSGVLKRTNRPSYRTLRCQRQALERQAQARVRRQLNDNEVLQLIDGVWFHFDLLPVPKVRIEYHRPRDKTEFEVRAGRSVLGVKRSWEELTAAQREKLGLRTIVGVTACDELTREVVYGVEGQGTGLPSTINPSLSYQRVPGKYHANKKTASKKHLRASGLSD